MNPQKVRIALDCTPNQRAYLKMAAASQHKTLSECILSLCHVPNEETLAAMKEVDEGKGHSFESIEDFWEQIGIDPHA